MSKIIAHFFAHEIPHFLPIFSPYCFRFASKKLPEKVNFHSILSEPEFKELRKVTELKYAELLNLQLY